jgi:hypothetical protein
MAWIIEILIGFIWWALLLPLVLAATTPVILLLSIKGRGSYSEKLKARYTGVIDFWKDHGWALTP